MFLLTNSILLISLLVYTKGDALNVSKKCALTDVECKKHMYETIFKQASGGIPQLNIKPADPMAFKHLVFISPKSVKLTLEDGVLTGIKNCNFGSYQTILKGPFYTSVSLTCDLELNGKYKVDVPKYVMEELGGEDLSTDIISGSGTGKALLEKLKLSTIIFFDFEWKNKDIYINMKNINLDHQTGDKSIVFSMDLDVGHKGNGKKIANYLKEHATDFNIEVPIKNQIKGFISAFLRGYLNRYPAKDLYTSDLSSFLHH